MKRPSFSFILLCAALLGGAYYLASTQLSCVEHPTYCTEN